MLPKDKNRVRPPGRTRPSQFTIRFVDNNRELHIANRSLRIALLVKLAIKATDDSDMYNREFPVGNALFFFARGHDKPALPAVMRFFHRSTFLQTVPDLYDRILCVTVRLRKRLRCHRRCGQRQRSRPQRCRPDGLRRGRRRSLRRLQTGRGWRSQ